MTPVAGSSASAARGLVIVSFIYDTDQTPPLITTVHVVNSAAQPVHVEARFLDSTDNHKLWEGIANVPVGTTDYNVSGFNYRMIQVNSWKYGPDWIYPFTMSVAG